MVRSTAIDIATGSGSEMPPSPVCTRKARRAAVLPCMARRAAPRSIALVAEPVLAMEPLGVGVLAPEGFGGARIHGRVRTAELRDVQCIAGRLNYRHVARDHRDGGHVDVWRAQRHDEGD